MDWLSLAAWGEGWAPTRCIACGDGRCRDALAFCRVCCDSVRPQHDAADMVDGQPLVAAFSYSGAVARAVTAMKFDASPPGWGGALSPWLCALAARGAEFDAVVAVAPSAVRLRDRGWHLPDLLASAAAAATGRPAPLALRRTDHQAARARGVHGEPTFCADAWALGGIRTLLIDDVLTTGTTLAAASRAIDCAGGSVVAYGVLADARPRVGAARQTQSAHRVTA
jgi:predicted amidophosphoribosyltransferase